MIREATCCRVCGNATLFPILHLGDQYLTGVFPRTRDQTITHGPLDLVKCDVGGGRQSCGLVQLRHSYDSGEMYGDHYGYRSSLNRSMTEHLRSTVERLVALVPLDRDDIVLDIGSNDGTLLSFYRSDGPEIVGMDPTAKKFGKFYPSHVRVIADFFSADAFRERFGDRRAKVVTSIAMFYDLDDPLDFMRQVHSILASDGVWHLEQSYLPSMLSVNAYDTICHEHVEYYALRQIKYMADLTDLKIIDVQLNDVNGGSFAVSVARQEAPYPAAVGEVDALLRTEERLGLDSPQPYEAFRSAVFAHRDRLRELLARLRERRQLVLGYGASTKGNVILQFCGITARELPYIAEVNEEKFGCCTPGTGIPIISEDAARAMKPGYFLALPWHFKQYLLEREAAFLSAGGRMIFPLPRIEVVPP